MSDPFDNPPKLVGPPRPPHRLTSREIGTVMIIMSLFVATGVGVILSSAEAASVALGIGLVITGLGCFLARKPSGPRTPWSPS